VKAPAAILIGLAALCFASPAEAQTEPIEIAKRRAAERKSFTDAEIADGFFRVAFGAELGLAGRINRVRKYDGPVRIFIESNAKPDRRQALQRVIDDIAGKVRGLDIAVTGERKESNFVVRLVRDRDVARTVRAIYGNRGGEIVRSLEPQCLSGFGKDAQYRITRSNVILAADVSDFIFLDCAYEELLQALGPIQDDDKLPWTMFNDKVQMGYFGLFDQYILNILYDRRIRPGMTRAQVRAALPEILPDVRAWVSRTNNLPR
jgi:hypothetical protein